MNLQPAPQKRFIALLNAAAEPTKQEHGISRRTIYRIISRGELDIAKFGTRTVIRRSDMDGFFTIPLQESMLRPVQVFPGLEQCYTITQIQQKFSISPGALYMLIQRHSIVKYAVGKFNYVAKKDIDIIFGSVASVRIKYKFLNDLKVKLPIYKMI
ncbi:helix-turn-helix domain-containing protein [Flavobacterium sp. LM4]|uniref:helix-turn-helix domain-containing protein n=1 Tax=Flavobacterium sp. LM4 TaxID=1938609 RepID=UPI0009D0604E|nr:helix-turn-helix domain-containing protein [Flavobacterium sp. LM4]OOV17555.1 hypothetical protein BXU10_15840 [Flavobacterium sp. LM4]